MSWLFGLFGKSEARPRAAYQNDGPGTAFNLNDPALLELIRTGGDGSGVTIETALKNPTVFRCCDLISSTIGMLPVNIQRTGADGKLTTDRAHPMQKVLNFRPNAWQTPFEFKSLMQFRALLKGNAYAAITRSQGRVIALSPIDPDRVEPKQNSDWSVDYRVTRAAGNVQTVNARDMLHIRGMSTDGIKGVSRVAKAAEAISLAMEAENAAAKIFKNGILAGGALSSPTNLSPEAYTRLKESMEQRYSGGNNAGKWMILEEGLNATTFSHSPVDSQQDETRRRQVEEIGKIFGVPRPLLNVDDTSWGSGIEQLSILFVVYGLAFWFKAWEDAIQIKCLDEADWGDVRADFDERELLRGSMKDQAEFYAKALGSGGHKPWMEANEVRDVVGLGSHKDGGGLVMSGTANTKGAPNEPPQTP